MIHHINIYIQYHILHVDFSIKIRFVRLIYLLFDLIEQALESLTNVDLSRPEQSLIFDFRGGINVIELVFAGENSHADGEERFELYHLFTDLHDQVIVVVSPIAKVTCLNSFLPGYI